MFYDHLKNICTIAGTSPSAVALGAGMSKSNVTGWQNGQSPSLETIVRLANQLGISPKDLIPEE